jgi:DNA sulfur modification protein DndC
VARLPSNGDTVGCEAPAVQRPALDRPEAGGGRSAIAAKRKPAAPPQSTIEKYRHATAEVRAEYLVDEPRPWIVGFSGGKDSTLLLQIVMEMLLELPPSQRRRPVHVLTNDTLVESPVLIRFIDTLLAKLATAVESLDLPITVAKTTPAVDQTFWVNLIGRGYPSPIRTFRWCTDRMKIQPTSNYIKSRVAESGEVILLLGVRRSESAVRAASAAKYTTEGRLNPHNDLHGCMCFRPILEFTTEEVWELLLQRPPPWGGQHRDLVTLYRNAQGGECPLVTEKSQAPSCGSSSSRLGCWTCTVVEKDRSAQGFVDAGFEDVEALMEFRDWLKSIRNDTTRRMAHRRNGLVTYMHDNQPVPGPWTLSTRAEILDRLLALQTEVDMQLISPGEVEEIRRIWSQDAAAVARRAIGATSLSK